MEKTNQFTPTASFKSPAAAPAAPVRSSNDPLAQVTNYVNSLLGSTIFREEYARACDEGYCKDNSLRQMPVKAEVRVISRSKVRGYTLKGLYAVPTTPELRESPPILSFSRDVIADFADPSPLRRAASQSTVLHEISHIIPLRHAGWAQAPNGMTVYSHLTPRFQRAFSRFSLQELGLGFEPRTTEIAPGRHLASLRSLTYEVDAQIERALRKKFVKDDQVLRNFGRYDWKGTGNLTLADKLAIGKAAQVPTPGVFIVASSSTGPVFMLFTPEGKRKTVARLTPNGAAPPKNKLEAAALWASSYDIPSTGNGWRAALTQVAKDYNFVWLTDE